MPAAAQGPKARRPARRCLPGTLPGMLRTVLLLLLAMALPGWALAQSQPLAQSLQEVGPATPQRGGEAAVVRSTVEDDAVRIEELRVRGQTRRLTVQQRLPGLGSYDVLPAEPGRAPERDPKAGQRVWWSLSF